MNDAIGIDLIIIIATVIIAGNKNRSLVGWFLASLFLSWVALIIVILLPHKYQCRR